ncbi:single-stranded DNA-binding protein [Rhodopila sp.]|uniref:single-stranded DNA-binding protein n=1 Tax=Rhodopila sp. TaxID=2480087 RepID=UPI003D0ACD17
MSNGTFSQTILTGRVGKDPTTHTFNDGSKRAAFSLATSESWKDGEGAKQEKTQWHLVVAFGPVANIVSDYVRQGDLVQVVGQNETREYEKDGSKRSVTEVVLRGPRASIGLLNSKREPG